MTSEDITNRFAYHPPTGEFARVAHEAIRRECGKLAHRLNDLLPEGREKSTAITKLEETMMWANAAIARNGGPK